ncbi:glycosyltransferase family 4 protein [Sodalis sp. RH20]|uniref:glycosyltransferase family 4 protein n=1 Tax=unclassified Sodalis (in: enterobacteria) TaxID=2636512 RepID=UPI0039B5B13D
MHILIDVQGLQTQSKFRGIGRSTLAMSRAIIRNAGENRVSILVNGIFPIDNIEETRHLYQDILPAEEIFTFSAHGPVVACHAENQWRHQTAEECRNIAIANINPDIVFVISFFEGHVDDYIVSIPDFPVKWRTICVCHDLIPYLNKEVYLADANFRGFYLERLHEYEYADAIFAISNSAADEVKRFTSIDHKRIFNISSAVEPEFCRLELDSQARARLKERYNLPDEYLLTLAMIEPRKNINALLQAFGMLSEELRDRYPLVMACKIRPYDLERTLEMVEKYGIKPNQIVFTGYLPDSDLIALYNTCKLFVFPSLHEGFGLPPLEAMSCGAATLSSNATSLPEVIGWSEAMFDPNDVNAIKAVMERALTDEDFFLALKKHALTQSGLFSWDRTAHIAWDSFAHIMNTPKMFRVFDGTPEQSTDDILNRMMSKTHHLSDTDKLGTAWAIARNNFSQHQRQLAIDVSRFLQPLTTAAAPAPLEALTASLLAGNVPGYQVRAISCNEAGYYHYANRYQAAHQGHDWGDDEPILLKKDDIVLVNVPTNGVFPLNTQQWDTLRRVGTTVYCLLQEQEIFINAADADADRQTNNRPVLSALARHTDGIICASDHQADQLRLWLKECAEEVMANPYLNVCALNAAGLNLPQDTRLLLNKLPLLRPAGK